MGVASVHCDEQYPKGKEAGEGYSECGVWLQNGFLLQPFYAETAQQASHASTEKHGEQRPGLHDNEG